MSALTTPDYPAFLTEIKAQAVLAVKDYYTFDFLGLATEHSERGTPRSLPQRTPQPRTDRRTTQALGRKGGGR